MNGNGIMRKRIIGLNSMGHYQKIFIKKKGLKRGDLSKVVVSVFNIGGFDTRVLEDQFRNNKLFGYFMPVNEDRKDTVQAHLNNSGINCEIKQINGKWFE